MNSLFPAYSRPCVLGKFIYVNGDKFYLRGATYGTFRPDEQGRQFPPQAMVHTDLAAMAANGFNAIRTYTVPPIHLLDIANQYGIKVMVGIPWEQHIAFLDSKQRLEDIFRRTTEAVLSCGAHPAILCYTIGNEIPAPMVRWYGKRKTERFLRKLFKVVKSADPEALVTYVNYPTTEYLELPFLDFHCFNVYLETPEKLNGYLARLHNLSGEKPLVLAEIGLDSLRNGVDKQAEVLDWQLRTIFGKGCAGAFVFAWTDEWWRGGSDIPDWDFGIVDRERSPKPALAAVSRAFREIPFQPEGKSMPPISVVVCSYNGARTIRDTLEGLRGLEYPDFEVIVVNDGSTDRTPDLVREYPEVKLINTSNRGLSNARNTGLYAAKGHIVAYIDDDAYPDPHWLQYLAYAYQNSDYAGFGGFNIAPDGSGIIADSVACAPGGPMHVLIDDETAEHIPGCNMSFLRSALLEIDGFDPVFRAAGDDVDVCWRIQAAGYKIGFHHGAFVWHHRRNSIKAYWKQQKGYGKAEALLEKKWPEKYNALGHLSWSGRIYGNGLTSPLSLRKKRVFHGSWGSALFQSVYEPAPGWVSILPLLPEWHLAMAILTLFSILGIWWQPLLFALPLLIGGTVVLLAQAISSAVKAASVKGNYTLDFCTVTAFLHLIQPFGRLYGRFQHGLTPWRSGWGGLKAILLLFKKGQVLTYWSETWRASEEWLNDIETEIRQLQGKTRHGGDFDRWDLQTNTGLFSCARGLLTVEEYGGGKQLLKFKIWTKYSHAGLLFLVILVCLALGAGIDHAGKIAWVLTFAAFAYGLMQLNDAANAVQRMVEAFSNLGAEPASENTTQDATLTTEWEPKYSLG